MNNLIKMINRTDNQYDLVELLKDNFVFDFVRSYLMENLDIDYTDHQFIDEQNHLSLDDIKYYVTDAIKASLL